jgi:hypothetical protein
MIVFSVEEKRQLQELPAKSILLQWNGWKLGDSSEALDTETHKSRFGMKNMYFMTPEGIIVHILVERGSPGISTVPYNIENSDAGKWMKQLEEWKKKNK